MLRAALLSVIIFFSCFALARNPNSQVNSGPQPSSAVQVVYVIDGSTLTTYNVDPLTLQATQVGTLTLQESIYPDLVASPNGKFLYYTAFENYSQQGEMLYVYVTDASGVPNSTPLQTLNATAVGGIVIDPKGNFLYTEVAGTQGPETTPYAIERYVMDPATGKIGQSVVEAKYELDSFEGGQFCNLGILGVNPAGTELYDAIPCSNPDRKSVV